MEYRKQQFQTYEEFTRQFPCDYSMPFARGGHGELYRGIDAETNDEVAIKRRLYSVGDDFLSLEKEYTNTQEVPANRFVVRYLYYGRYATPFGTYEYLVMRYYRDGNLTSQVLPWYQLTELLRRRFIEEFLHGLNHLHTHHIIHRDVKPENVLLVRYTDNGQPAYRPVLADFGISKVLTDHPEIARTLVQNSMRVGTVTYMAPEQLRGSNITYNSDLWSFGVILYEIITGKHMIARRSFPEQQREEAYGFWRDVDDGRLPDDLDTVAQPYQALIRQCLVVNPRNRVQRATDLIDLLLHTQTTPAQVSTDHPVSTGLTGVPASRMEAALTEQLDDDLPTVLQRPTPVPTQPGRSTQADQPVAKPSQAVPASQLTMQLTELFDVPTIGQVVPVHRPEPQPIKVEAQVEQSEAEQIVLPVEQPPQEDLSGVATVPSPVKEVVQPVELVHEKPEEPPIAFAQDTLTQVEPAPVDSLLISTESVQAEPIQAKTESTPVESVAIEPVQAEPIQAEPVLTDADPAVPVQQSIESIQPAVLSSEPVTSLEEPATATPDAPSTPTNQPVAEPAPAKPLKPAKQPVLKQRTVKPAPSLRPLVNQARQVATQSAIAVHRWGQTRLIPGATATFGRASQAIMRGSDALSKQPWLTKLMLQGWVVVILTVLVYSSGPDIHVPTAIAQPVAVKQSESYQIARQRFNQAQRLYRKTGVLDAYLWTFIKCNPTFEDSLTQSAIYRSDSLLLNNQRLFPNYRGNPAGLKRQEQKRLLLDKISWESKPHDADELSCQPQQP